MSKRLLMANVLDRSGATDALLSLRRVVGTPWIPVVTFHRVLDRTRHAEHVFDEDVVDSSPEEFERHIRTIRRYFTPIGIADVTRSLDGGPLPLNPILVTFDDGYRDNLEVALPILRRHNVKAVFFIATRYLTERRMFWWDRVSYILKRTTRRRIRLAYPVMQDLPLVTAAERAHAKNAILRIVKAHHGLDLERYLDEVARAADVPWTTQLDRELADSVLMTWDQVRSMRRAGMDIQSHTRTHRVLQTLTPAQLDDELRGSREDLEREMSEPITSISYPVGHRVTTRHDVRAAVKAAGYRIGFTNATGTVRERVATDPYDVSRIAVDVGMPDALFRARLAAPFLFG